MADARKRRIEADEAWDLLRTARAITTAKGSKVRRLDPLVDGREAILREVIGSGGSLRAPTCRAGDTFIVGFNRDLYQQWTEGG
ncbi:MAG: hypothetical protein OEV91_10735 [Desulfobulbaceae bacterium]|nr:hypothetical protein [Desulfobulbaceae bacterium]